MHKLIKSGDDIKKATAFIRRFVSASVDERRIIRDCADYLQSVGKKAQAAGLDAIDLNSPYWRAEVCELVGIDPADVTSSGELVVKLSAWIDQQRVQAKMSADVAGESEQPNNGNSIPPYLGITIDDREVSRVVDGQNVTVDLGDKPAQWPLFKALFDAGENGVHRSVLEDLPGSSLDKNKAALLTSIEELKLDILPKLGIWKLTHLGTDDNE